MGATNNEVAEVDRVKQEFSTELVECLKRVYGGRMPSIATVARDFSLKSPHLAHISNETIRKWIRGDSLPHVSRMQVLIDWLGPKIGEPFDKPIKAIKFSQNGATQSSNQHRSNGDKHPMHDELVSIIDRLTEKECQSILAIARLLADKEA